MYEKKHNRKVEKRPVAFQVTHLIHQVFTENITYTSLIFWVNMRLQHLLGTVIYSNPHVCIGIVKRGTISSRC